MGGRRNRFFARKLTGLTDDILSDMIAEEKKKHVKPKRPTRTYQLLSTMKDYGLTLGEWKRLTRLEKKILTYARIMEKYYLDKEQEEINKRSERDRKWMEFVNQQRVRMPRR